jgi:hypothetical protein
MESNRPYISYSQYALFKSSPKAYYEKYVLDKSPKGTKYQQFGKRLMEDLEFAELRHTPKRLRDLTEGKIIEYELTAKSKQVHKDLFGIIDVLSTNKQSFFEIKTGKLPWTKAKVMKDEQMLFYALMIFLEFGVIPSAKLIWIETEDTDDNSVKFTGKIEEFTREFTLEELVWFENELLNFENDLDEYEMSIVEVDTSKDAKLLELLTEKKRIDEELDLLKAEIMLEIKEFSDKYAQSENFNITLAQRKNYSYSDELTTEIKKSNDDFKCKKVEEEKSGVATFKVTEYLVIKPKK